MCFMFGLYPHKCVLNFSQFWFVCASLFKFLLFGFVCVFYFYMFSFLFLVVFCLLLFLFLFLFLVAVFCLSMLFIYFLLSFCVEWCRHHPCGSEAFCTLCNCFCGTCRWECKVGRRWWWCHCRVQTGRIFHCRARHWCTDVPSPIRSTTVHMYQSMHSWWDGRSSWIHP